jgi:modification methylase
MKLSEENKNTESDITPYLNKIICGDSLEVMRKMPSESIDLMVTSPPYNLKNSTGNGMKAGTKTGRWANNPLQNGYAHHSDEMPHDKYVEWQRACLTEVMRLLKDDGAIFYNHKRRVQGGIMQDRDDIVNGFPVRQIIIWKRAGGFNFNPGYFVPSYEVIYLICKPKFKLAPKKNGYTDVWEFPQEMKNKHPAPFPVGLPHRCIESTTAQVILDPFSGSGTTALVAKQLGRNYIGIDISPEYCETAQARIDGTETILLRENSLFDLANG